MRLVQASHIEGAAKIGALFYVAFYAASRRFGCQSPWLKIKALHDNCMPEAITGQETARGRAMRELIGRSRTKDPSVTEEVYLTEVVRCQECEQTVPIGIEVVTRQKRPGF